MTKHMLHCQVLLPSCQSLPFSSGVKWCFNKQWIFTKISGRVCGATRYADGDPVTVILTQLVVEDDAATSTEYLQEYHQTFHCRSNRYTDEISTGTGEKETGRIFWSAVGDILEALPFLPFTINVPDAIAGMWNFVTGFFPGGGSGNKKPMENSTAETGLTRDDLIDYFLY
ncbi:hypothetical protein J6590_004009 [Homalodisca vitripennis]|nr:hypothetical protein J6590_004009 [Homalodisca vitripennis]